MRLNRSRDTRPELALRRAVFARGLRYRVAYEPLKGVRRSADIAFTKVKVAVFLDGCFWRGCPTHYTTPKANAEFWAKKVKGNQARDRETDALFADAGWVVIRVWEHEDVMETVDRIIETVTERRALMANSY
ncbi:DNA mismatch endonuclease Vsr [Catenulispora acidiphila DSM 44928]|uniref:DNA mismatch endonuclease Vsr n=2 Tax=Catenulispora TaxID=414878 RepID=C7PYN7_CATAD|nr:DNA mismatch endonuclease Vsr [Catenulispora acidiphila DSM 44928]